MGSEDRVLSPHARTGEGGTQLRRNRHVLRVREGKDRGEGRTWTKKGRDETVREGRATTIGDGGHARKARNETKHDSKADVVRSVRGMERNGRVLGRI